MKHLLFILIVLLNVVLYSQDKIINLQSENLKGKVQSYEKKTFIIDQNSKALIQKYSIKYTFNKKGDIISIENFGDDAKSDSKEVFEYKNHKISKTNLFNAMGKTNKMTLYDYDDKGYLTLQKKYNKQGKLQYETSYMFNQKGQLTVQQKLIPSINYMMKESYKYDANNNLIEKAKTARIGTTKEIFEYNSQGLETKKSEYNAMGELYSVIVYEYNKQGDKTRLKKYDVNDVMNYHEKYDYKYDSKGNWTECISFEKGEKVTVDKRAIFYY